MRAGLLLKLFIVVILCTLAGCVSPIGDVGGSGTADSLWAVPRRQVYNLGDDFVRADDMWVFASRQSGVEAVDVDWVSIGLVTNPDSTQPNDPITINNGVYRLSTQIGKGRKCIIITYENLSAEYSIEVQDPFGLIDDDSGNGNGNGNGNENGGGIEIGIEWR